MGPAQNYLFLKISLIDICGNYEPIFNFFSEITLFSEDWKLGENM